MDALNFSGQKSSVTCPVMGAQYPDVTAAVNKYLCNRGIFLKCGSCVIDFFCFSSPACCSSFCRLYFLFVQEIPLLQKLLTNAVNSRRIVESSSPGAKPSEFWANKMKSKCRKGN